MKKLLLILASITLFSSCEEEGYYTQTTTNENNPINLMVLKSGVFNPTSGISVVGSAELVSGDNKNFIRLYNKIN